MAKYKLKKKTSTAASDSISERQQVRILEAFGTFPVDPS